ncbi:MAG TPA: LLM class flavin-dependent oxidoreductase [Acidimicrobiales bacterium]|nr:LLM class flavin-dependent oxidoreductase [Acidimicrobiales bacterium]
MHDGLYLPPFGELADPLAMIDVCVAAEEQGWDGVFLWDHLLRPGDQPAEIADVWVQLAAVAVATSRIRIGPMVTPVVRRRPQKLAREALTLDHLSGGRLTVGLGLGVDTSGELSRFGEIVDAKERGDALDEGAALLVQLLSGEEVDHRGRYFTAAGVRYRPTPLQSPSIPIWMAARGEARRPVRRAARYDGLFPIEVDADGLSRMLDIVVTERGSLDGFDVAVLAEPGVDIAAMAARGATWALRSFAPGQPVADVLAVIAEGPARG